MAFWIACKIKRHYCPSPHVDVALVVPKESGRSVRANFLDGSGINASCGSTRCHRPRDGTYAHAGNCYRRGLLFPTTFENEVYSDLTGERGILMGALAGVMEAQYNELRKHGHTPSEAFNETVEELTQSLIRLVGQNGMDWMYANCSTTTHTGTFDWKNKFHDAVAPVFNDLWSVVAGEETQIVLEKNSDPKYRENLDAELKVMRESEMWQAGAAVRSLRPESWKK